MTYKFVYVVFLLYLCTEIIATTIITTTIIVTTIIYKNTVII